MAHSPVAAPGSRWARSRATAPAPAQLQRSPAPTPSAGPRSPSPGSWPCLPLATALESTDRRHLVAVTRQRIRTRVSRPVTARTGPNTRLTAPSGAASPAPTGGPFPAAPAAHPRSARSLRCRRSARPHGDGLHLEEKLGTRQLHDDDAGVGRVDAVWEELRVLGPAPLGERRPVLVTDEERRELDDVAQRASGLGEDRGQVAVHLGRLRLEVALAHH